MLAGVINYHNQENYELRDRELTKLTLLVSELNDIEHFSHELLVQFRNMYKKNRVDYYGFRMEVAAASLFIRRTITFKKNESPDFIVTVPNNENIFVECGSAHLSKHKDRDIGYKIASMVSGKVAMPYVNTRTVLFLDITNIIHHTLISEIYLEQEQIESIVKKEMNAKPVGGTCLFFYMLDKEKDYLGYHSIRINNDNVDHVLQKFLDEQFRLDGQEISNYDVPSMG